SVLLADMERKSRAERRRGDAAARFSRLAGARRQALGSLGPPSAAWPHVPARLSRGYRRSREAAAKIPAGQSPARSLRLQRPGRRRDDSSDAGPVAATNVEQKVPALRLELPSDGAAADASQIGSDRDRTAGDVRSRLAAGFLGRGQSRACEYQRTRS